MFTTLTKWLRPDSLTRRTRTNRIRASIEALEDRTVMNGAFYVLANTGGTFSQDWGNAGLITADNNWGTVPSIEGFNGAGLASSAGQNPSNITATGGSLTVLANQSNPVPLPEILSGFSAESGGVIPSSHRRRQPPHGRSTCPTSNATRSPSISLRRRRWLGRPRPRRGLVQSIRRVKRSPGAAGAERNPTNRKSLHHSPTPASPPGRLLHLLANAPSSRPCPDAGHDGVSFRREAEER